MEEPVVDTEAVRHVADLAHVDIDEAELERYAAEFQEILGWFEALEEVPAVTDSDAVSNVLRPDTVEPGLDRDDALANAAETEDGYFRGPPVG